MIKEELKKKIDEAIASENTSDSNKELLIKLRRELEVAKNEKDYFSLTLKLIDLIGALAKVFIGSS